MSGKKLKHWRGSRIRAVRAPAFIHIPKTGGTYLMQLESGKSSVLEGVSSFGHSYVTDRERDVNPIYSAHSKELARQATIPRSAIQSHYVFSTVRNVFSWLVSYAGHAAGWNPRYEASRHYDHAHALKGFDYLVKVIANREDQWPNRKLIHCQLFSSGGDLVVDQINRQESLDDDLAEMASRLGIGYQKKALQRLGARKNYRECYNSELIEMVGRTWNRELALFGYSFDGCDRESAIIKGVIDREQKEAIKYCWKRDKLTVAGREFARH